MKFAIVGLLTAVYFGTCCLSVDTDNCQRRVCNLKLTDGFYVSRQIRLDPTYCTHVILYRTQLTDTMELYGGVELEIQQIIDLKNVKPDLILIYAVQNLEIPRTSDPKRDFAEFVKMYNSESLRNNFTSKIIDFLRAKNIEGLKIDVQTAEGGDKENFTQLFKELKEAFIEESARTNKTRLLLTVGIPSNKTFLDTYYDVAAISNYVDMVDLATHSFLYSQTCIPSPVPHSPLYSQDPSSTRTIDFMSRYVAGMGVSKEKINVGLSFYGVMYYKHNNTIWCTGFELKTYSIICTREVFDGRHSIAMLDTEVGRLVTSDGGTRKTYYEDPETIRMKVKYVIENGYGGVLLTYARYDDTFSFCGYGSYPLLKAVYDECRNISTITYQIPPSTPRETMLILD